MFNIHAHESLGIFFFGGGGRGECVYCVPAEPEAADELLAKSL